MLSIARLSIALFALSCIWIVSAQNSAPYVALLYFNDSTCHSNDTVRGSVVVSGRILVLRFADNAELFAQYLDRPCEQVPCAKVGTTDWYQIKICPQPPFHAVEGWVSVWQYADKSCSSANLTRILTGTEITLYYIFMLGVL